MTATRWSVGAVASIRAPIPESPVFTRRSLREILPAHDLWDYWPVQELDGTVARIANGALFMFLSASKGADPEERHAIARLRLFHRVEDRWTDLGPVLPGELSPGSREWAGSAVVSREHGEVTLYFTAAGRRCEDVVTFEQRIFEASAVLRVGRGLPELVEWSQPTEIVRPDGEHYVRDMSGGGGLGTIKAFRDPAHFRDPRDGARYLLFAASLANSASRWNGAVGMALKDGAQWRLLPPIISADGVNNELERPHIVARAGRYYCFWSTQRKVFADGLDGGPDGLYGMVADDIVGPWRPLNGSGLVLANPSNAPHQAYSWLVLPDLRVLSFADAVEVAERPTKPGAARAAFGGVPAPDLRIGLDGARSWLV